MKVTTEKINPDSAAEQPTESELYMVPMAGVEPAQLTPLPPQGSVSTNFTTSAFKSITRVLLPSMALVCGIF